MPIHNIKMIAFDIDGTLLTSDEDVSLQTSQAIQTLRQKGIAITLVSGRTYNSVSRIAEQLGIEGLLVAYNGAYVAHPYESSPVYHQPMEWQIIQPLLLKLEEEKVYTKVYINDMLYVQKETDETILFSQRHNVSYKETGPGGLSKLGENPSKIVVIDEPKRISEVYRLLEPWHQHLKFFKEKHGIEINHQSIHKAHGLRQVCLRYELDMMQVMAFGNETNDIEMIQETGIGVAMGNAVSELKDRADFISKSNDENGIIFALQQFGII